ncbi:MAG: isoprenylcysteine carboxylmethyltransferase family protein, partial [Gammaproteobacteria bacterium]|nr:isoprenylcysteine carboxylmethyltransferase family protein [Gammaproteobacteria bacterium]
VLFLIGLLILAISAYSFRKAKTTVNPIYPEKSSALVIAGIYRHSRNPMYIAFLLWVLAGIVYFENVINLVFIPIFIILSNKLYIEREEHALEKIFGESFTIYKTQVRRWL